MRFSRRSGIGTALIVAVVIIVVAAAGIGVYLATSSPSSSSTTTPSTTQTPTQTQTTTSSSASLATTSQASTSSSVLPASTTSTPAPTSTQTTTTTSTTPSSQTTQTTTGVACTTTYTSTTAAQNPGASIQTDIIPLLQSFSNLSVSFSGTSNGTSYNEQATYGVVSRTNSSGVTTYQMIIHFSTGSTVENITAWVQSDGNVPAVEQSGFNLTGTEAQGVFVGLMSPFTIDSTFVNELQVYTGSYFMTNGTFVQTYGVTNGAILHETSYVATTLPETFNQCGVSATLNAFHMDVAQLQGTNVYLVAYLHLDGTENGQSADFTLNLVWAITYG